MDTQINSVGDPQAIRSYSSRLAVDVAKNIWWKQFVGTEETAIVQERLDLQSGPGDVLQFDLSMRLRGDGVYGDETAAGKEESLAFMTDEVKIDQIRKPISAGTKMSQKRTLHDLRKIVKARGRDWFAQWHDEVYFAYASGAAATTTSNEDAIFAAPTFATNAIEAPDAAHIVYAGAATAKANLAATDKMTVDLIRRIAAKVTMLNAQNPTIVDMQPGEYNGEMTFAQVMNPVQALDMKRNTATGEWADIVKLAQKRGSDNPIFGTELGRIDGIVLKSHPGVRRFSDYGAGANVLAARSLVLGRQALTCAYGSGNGTRMFWEEEMRDYKNNFSCLVGMIFGAKKTRYKPKQGGAGTDFGVISVDTAAIAA